MNIETKINELKKLYNIVDIVNLDPWHDQLFHHRKMWLTNQISAVYKSVYNPNDRIIFTLTKGDEYISTDEVAGALLTDFQKILNTTDISNFFVILLTNDGKFIPNACDWLQENISLDPIPFTNIVYASEIEIKGLKKELTGNYTSKLPANLDKNLLTEKQKFLLTESKTFCIYPWVHLHAHPTGQAYPCCMTDQPATIGNTRNSTLKELWNSDKMKELRVNMLNNKPNDACIRCYEQESHGFYDGRSSANRHHGHHIARTDETLPDGTLERFEMSYWDIRFSNLCNLSCRSCGHIFSSSWYQDQAKLAGPKWAQENKPLILAGKNKTDMWKQLLLHIDYVEQIYFAGGEPLMMEEHYNILDELERRGRFDVRLIYNTNFTQTKLKDRTVFDYWKQFKSVSVGASLDAMGPRAEYIRKGTKWDEIERNRALMLEICPDVDFYVSPTLSILNALHLPDFHRDWVNKGFIKPQDLNVNILQDPTHYRIDVAPANYKQRIQQLYNEHLEWLRPLDSLARATVGFESAINYMMASDNTAMIPKFWSKTLELDKIRNENILDTIPELEALKL